MAAPASSHPQAAGAAAGAAFCKALPKCELHAHLHGSIRNSTLAELVQKSQGTLPDTAKAIIQDILPAPHRSLSDCFKVFDLIHGAVTDEASVERILREMVEDCAEDNITYLEIRSTPRALRSSSSSESPGTAAVLPLESYVQCLTRTLAAMEHEAHAAGRKQSITVRLLLSINRTGSVAAAEQIVQLACTYAAHQEVVEGRSYGPYVVGMDFSGDPTRGRFADFLPALTRAREAGLKLTLHCAEVFNVAETEAMLDFRPERLGHMCVLTHTTLKRLLAGAAARTQKAAGAAAASTSASSTGSPKEFEETALVATVADSSSGSSPATPPAEAGAAPALPQLPIELCPTSNALTLHLPSLTDHPTLPGWIERGYPFAICTDDSGVFNVSLSSEYTDVMQANELSKEQMAKLALQAFSYAFLPAEQLLEIRRAAEKRVEELLALKEGH